MTASLAYLAAKANINDLHRFARRYGCYEHERRRKAVR
jgi:hypothetical protein